MKMGNRVLNVATKIEIKEIKDSKGNHLKINLIQKINNCCAIKPRFSVKKGLFEKYESIPYKYSAQKVPFSLYG